MKRQFNYCKTYHISCPYALSENSPLPCYAKQEQCDNYREYYEIEKSFYQGNQDED